ncbi:hypothetical protein HZH66_003126 [Vespula vulgaris]|uniref:Uncharacterized protein n=1 Tax=Vespula vulgaris TaxID=7454 RepID=A0A834NI16_VESVU|nr:hypothetical protein HZH66_003126 [Vespula vulgaris]
MRENALTSSPSDHQEETTWTLGYQGVRRELARSVGTRDSWSTPLFEDPRGCQDPWGHSTSEFLLCAKPRPFYRSDKA